MADEVEIGVIPGCQLDHGRIDRQMRLAWARLSPDLPRQRPTVRLPASRREPERLTQGKQHGGLPCLRLAARTRHQPDKGAEHGARQGPALAPRQAEHAMLRHQRIKVIPGGTRHGTRALPPHAAGTAGALVVTTDQPDSGCNRFARLPSHRRGAAVAHAVVPAILQAGAMAQRALPRHLATTFELAAHEVIVGHADARLGRSQSDSDRGAGRLGSRLPRVPEVEIGTTAVRRFPRPPEFKIDGHGAIRSVQPVPR